MIKYLVLLLPLFAFSQSGEITYGEFIGDTVINLESIKKDRVRQVIQKQINDKRKALEKDFDVYTMNFNNEKSFFHPISRMESDANRAYQNAITKGSFYRNINENFVFRKLNFSGKILRIKLPTNQFDWKIINKFQTINGLNCQKATAIFDNGVGGTSIVKVWFTEDVPINIGPKNYIGLPGLIVKVKHLGRITYLKSLKFKQNVKINFPVQGEKMTLDEYNNKLTEFMSY